MFVRIRNLREDNDLTQREIAEYLFCDQSLYSKYERGLRDVPVEIIIQLAKFYNTSTDYRASLKTPFEKKTAMHDICFVNLPWSATARLRKVSLQLPHLSVFSLIKRVFRDALYSWSD